LLSATATAAAIANSSTATSSNLQLNQAIQTLQQRGIAVGQVPAAVQMESQEKKRGRWG